ncbi:CsbD family protein [Sphingomonas sp. I4]
MNTDTMNGAATDFGGKVKQGMGAMLGDKTMEADGKGEQLGGKAQRRSAMPRPASTSRFVRCWTRRVSS